MRSSMTKSSLRAARLIVLVAVVTLGMTGWAVAGNYHYLTKLNCSSCHVMHGSDDTVLYPTGDGSGMPSLLRGTINQTCLNCHMTTCGIVATGTAASPNDTVASAYTSKYKSGGGYFQSDCATVPNPAAHDLGGGHVTAVQGTWSTALIPGHNAGMDCTDCHDPHGNPNYRNLLLRPGNSTTGDVHIEQDAQVYIKTGVSGTLGRDTGNIAFNTPNNVATWCLGCHTNIMGDTKHPQNEPISGLGATAVTHWTNGTTGTIGFGDDIGDATAGIPRVRFAQSGASYTECSTPGGSNEVFCLSCHKAHGSKYDSTLLWPHYTAGAADQTSGCGQCHNSGG